MAQKKAFVRYAQNKAVPGSLIVRTKAPKVGTWKEVPYDICCDGGGCSNIPIVGEYKYATENCFLGDNVQIAVFSCNNELTLKTFPDLLPVPNGYYRPIGQPNTYIVENSIVIALAPECP